MAKTAGKAALKSLDEADEVREFEKGRLELVSVAGRTVGRATKAGDVTDIPAGHDAWFLGDEPVVLVDFQGFADYAKPR